MIFLFGIDFDLPALFFLTRIGNKAEELYSEAAEDTKSLLFTF